MAWVSSKEFANTINVNYAALKMSCIRAARKDKKICSISSYILQFRYSSDRMYEIRIRKLEDN